MYIYTRISSATIKRTGTIKIFAVCFLSDNLNKFCNGLKGFYKIIHLFTFIENRSVVKIRYISNSDFRMICDKVQDIVFVCSLNMDVAGAAIATDIAQALSCFAAIIYMVKKYPLFRWKLKELTFEWSLVSALVKSNWSVRTSQKYFL